VAEQQVTVGKLCVGLAGARVNMDASVEYRTGGFAGDAFEYLVGGAMRRGVLDAYLVIDMAVVARDKNTAQHQVGAFPPHPYAHVIMAQRFAAHQLEAFYATVALLVDFQLANMQGIRSFALQAVMKQLGIRTAVDTGVRAAQHRAFTDK